MIVDSKSLVKTVENINDMLLFNHIIPPTEGVDTALWIAARQGEKGAYRELFAPTEYDFEQGIRLFTGEKITSAGARHITGQEAARAAWLLGRDNETVRSAYDIATQWMKNHPEFHHHGTFCCGKCSLAFWRHYWVGDFTNKEALISKGLLVMRDFRKGGGKWQRYPFFYAIYTLMDLPLEQARDELRYAQPSMEKYLNRAQHGSTAARRFAILEKALDAIH